MTEVAGYWIPAFAGMTRKVRAARFREVLADWSASRYRIHSSMVRLQRLSQPRLSSRFGAKRQDRDPVGAGAGRIMRCDRGSRLLDPRLRGDDKESGRQFGFVRRWQIGARESTAFTLRWSGYSVFPDPLVIPVWRRAPGPGSSSFRLKGWAMRPDSRLLDSRLRGDDKEG